MFYCCFDQGVLCQLGCSLEVICLPSSVPDAVVQKLDRLVSRHCELKCRCPGGQDVVMILQALLVAVWGLPLLPRLNSS